MNDPAIKHAEAAEQPTNEATGQANVPFQPRVLIAEDDEPTARRVREILEGELGLRVDTVVDGQQAVEALQRNFYSIFLTDLKLPYLDGMSLIHEIGLRRIPVTVIVLTASASIDLAVAAIRSGAYDILTKPLDPERLKLAVQHALQERARRDEVGYLREQPEARPACLGVCSKNPRVLAILDLVNNIAHTTTTVLIEGETGTGKELIARAIHHASAAVRPGPLVVLNCAAVPENLLESELFGHEKGAFTSAIAQRKGRFEQASGGTIFLDEVGEIPLAMQVKLLRVLQDRRFERVGGTEPIDVDVRVIAATNRPLARLVKKGTFREDLYYRLNVVRIEVPPLRERPEDIPLLVHHFCEKFAQPGARAKDVAPPAMEALLNHSWPGNVRELENVIERACVTCQDRTVGLEHLPADLTHVSRTPSPFAIDLSCPLPDLLSRITRYVESRYIRKALAKTHGHVGRCAKICGLSRRSITSKLARYKIDRDELHGGADGTSAEANETEMLPA
jgi:DNA-binding NtrC family response regulator